MKWLAIVFCFLGLSLAAQEDSLLRVVDFPDEDAQFPGGTAAMLRFINENLVYPSSMIPDDDCPDSRYYLEFVVLENGSIIDPIVRNKCDLNMDENLNELIEKMPNWIPAKVQGEVVASRVRIPVIIHLK